MITEQVLANIERFKGGWGKVISRSSWYEQDGSWPALGLFDLLTYRLRQRPRINEEQADIIKAAASTIGVLAEKCWSLLGVQAEVREGALGVEIEATGGGLGPETQYLAIENQLIKVLAYLPTPFPVIGKFRRINLPDDNIIFPFALGALTGLSPYAEGPWKKIPPEDYVEFSAPVIKEIARSCADYYARVLPEESFGQLAELYYGGLIFPPPEADNSLPGSRGIKAILDLRDEYGIKPKSLLRLSEGLALMPDPVIQAAGIAFHAGLSEATPSHRFLAAAAPLGTRLGLLRLIAVEVRRQCGLTPDWIGVETPGEAEQKRFELERAIGMLPWIRLGPGKVLQPSLQALFYSLASFEMAPAVSILDQLIAEDPKRFDLRFQRTYLDLVCGDLEAAERRGKNLISEPGCESDPMVFDLVAMAEFGQKKAQDALRRSKIAFTHVSAGHPFGPEIMGNYSWLLLANNNFEEAVDVVDLILRNTPNRLSPLLNKAYALKNLGRNGELAVIEKELLELAPFDRRVFANLASAS